MRAVPRPLPCSVGVDADDVDLADAAFDLRPVEPDDLAVPLGHEQPGRVEPRRMLARRSKSARPSHPARGAAANARPLTATTASASPARRPQRDPSGTRSGSGGPSIVKPQHEQVRAGLNPAAAASAWAAGRSPCAQNRLLAVGEERVEQRLPCPRRRWPGSTTISTGAIPIGERGRRRRSSTSL